MTVPQRGSALCICVQEYWLHATLFSLLAKHFLSDKWRLKVHNSDVSFLDVGSYSTESVVVGVVAMLDVIPYRAIKRNVASEYDADWL